MKQKLVEKIYSSWNILKKQRNTLLAFCFFVVVGSVVWSTIGSVNFAQAEPPPAPPAAPPAAPPTPAPEAKPPAAQETKQAGGGNSAGPVDNSTALTKEFWIGLIVSFLLALARLCLSITLFIMTFIIQVAGYNGFLDSSAVTVGWVMVRDITNMGFVVVLLVIAFGTILGLEHYEWKKMLVKLVMAAILVNFSRTICGVFIDIAQVVMVTFVNGIAATAGGNLIQMFHLDTIRELGADSKPDTFNTMNFFLAGVMSLVFSSIVMVTMGAFLLMLIARMIVLWVLIVLSPLAFVLSILPQTQQYAGQWWSEFGKNVITGPVLLFFVWLAFVTAGNGKINDEIAGDSVTAAANGSEADQLSGQSSGIGEVMDWNNMANFVIAIGMLIVGSKAAAQLGGIGGDWAGSAVDFGKKVGMYAGGVMAAKWAMDKGKDGAGFVANKIPLVGGDAWRRRAEESGAKWSMIGSTISTWRNNKAKDFEKDSKARIDLKGEYERGDLGLGAEGKKNYERKLKALGGRGLEAKQEFEGVEKGFKETEKDFENAKKQLAAGTLTQNQFDSVKTGYDNHKRLYDIKKDEYTSKLDAIKPSSVGGVFGAVARAGKDTLARAVQSGGRADKIAEDWKDAAEFAHTVVEKDYSTSALASGQIKAKLRVMAEAAEHMSHEKGVQKSEEMKRALSVGGGTLDERKLFEKFEKKAIEAGVRTERAKSFLDTHAIDLKAKNFEYAGNQINYFSNKIQMESQGLKREEEEMRKLSGAAASANQFVRANMLEQQANGLSFNKVQQGLKEAGLNSNERANLAGSLIDKINETIKLPDSAEKTELLKQYVNQKMALTGVNASLTSYDAQEDMRRSLKKAGWNEEYTAENSTRRFLTAQLGEVVPVGMETEYDNRLKSILGDKGYEAAMRQLGANAKNQIAQGNRDYAGLVDEVPDEQGVTDYSVTIKRGADRAKDVIGTLEVWRGNDDLDVGKKKEMDGSRRVDASGSFLVKISNEESVGNANFMAGMNANSIGRMKGGILSDLDNSALTMNESDLILQLQNIATKVLDKSAFEAVRKKLTKVEARLTTAQMDNIRDSFASASRSSSSP